MTNKGVVSGQQGFVLVTSLILMLLVGLVVMSSFERSGTEQRVATSTVNTASALAAAEAGLYRVKRQLSKAREDCADNDDFTGCIHEKFASSTGLAEFLNLDSDSELGSGTENDRRLFNAVNDSYWWIPKHCFDAGSNSVQIHSYGEIGVDSENPVQRVLLSATIDIDENPANGSENPVAGEDTYLNQLFGQSAAITQAASLSGSGKIYGNVAAISEPSQQGNPTFDGQYQEISAEEYLDHQGTVDAYFDRFAELESQPESNNGVPSLGGWPYVESELAPEAWRGFNQTWNVQDWDDFNLSRHPEQEFMGQEMTVFLLDELNIASNAKVHVQGGDVLLYIDGDVDFSGNGNLTIDSDSSLTVITTGRFRMGGSFSMDQRDIETDQTRKEVLNDNKYPLFSVYTNYTQTGNNDHGARVEGSTDFYGVIYSANADVRVTGSGDIYGSVYGQDIKVEGNASISYMTSGIEGHPSSGEGLPDASLNTDFDYIFDDNSPVLQCN